MSVVNLVSGELTLANLRSLLREARWPAETLVMLEGDRGICFGGAANCLPEVPGEWARGRVFWADAELRWQQLAPDRVRVVFAGEASPPDGIGDGCQVKVHGKKERESLCLATSAGGRQFERLTVRDYYDEQDEILLTRLTGAR